MTRSTCSLVWSYLLAGPDRDFSMRTEHVPGIKVRPTTPQPPGGSTPSVQATCPYRILAGSIRGPLGSLCVARSEEDRTAMFSLDSRSGKGNINVWREVFEGELQELRSRLRLEIDPFEIRAAAFVQLTQKLRGFDNANATQERLEFGPPYP